MQKHTDRRYSIIVLLIISTIFIGCAGSRPPIPQGTIPQPRTPTISEEQYGHTVLTELSDKYVLDYNDKRLDSIINVVDKLTTVIGANKDPWHVYLFNAPEVVNAAATRGNHVFVWSGMLDFAQTDEQLAVVISHEIAHVLARHTDPDPSEQTKKMLIMIGATAAGIAVSVATNNPNFGTDLGDITASLTNEVGNELLVYPYTREMELEADHIGMLLIASAKYDPHSAIEFWENAKNNPHIGSNMKYFSSHPDTQDRLNKLKNALPLAMSYFDGSRSPATLPIATQQNANASNIISQQTISNPITDSVKINTPFQNLQDYKHYKINKDQVILYRAPQTTSPRIGEFQNGATIVVGDQIGNWLEVLQPDCGYIRAEEAEVTTEELYN